MQQVSWPQIGDIVKNHGAGKPPHSTGLEGKRFALNLGGKQVHATFKSNGELEWIEDDVVTVESAEIFRLRDGMYFVDFIKSDNPNISISIIVDLNISRYLVIHVLAPAENVPIGLMERVTLRGSQSAVDVNYYQGSLSGEKFSYFPRTAELIGKHFRYRYSDTHEYDHIYLSEEYYTWFCREGPDKGLGDFDECNYFLLDKNLYLVCWREKFIPCVGVTVEDMNSMRSVGKIFGADSYGGTTANETVGSVISHVSEF